MRTTVNRLGICGKSGGARRNTVEGVGKAKKLCPQASQFPSLEFLWVYRSCAHVWGNL